MKNTQSTQQTIDFLHVAEVTLTYVTKVKPSERLVVSCSRDAHKIFFDSGIITQLNTRSPLRCSFLIGQTKSLELPLSLKGDFPVQ